ncbi:hypothetical protein P5673_031075 [Acropora cervicornis]|uniref:Uncharacterized protein n=1 Tax=Acropora cervicornis TaxID=6130 RepID=A0AAD9UT47_ACRCE|nr:hypothetical protein P5673_031075 [Acropora cervicornis]
MTVIGVEEALHGPSNCSGPPLTGYMAMRLREKQPDNKKITRLDILDNPALPHTNLHGAVHEMGNLHQKSKDQQNSHPSSSNLLPSQQTARHEMLPVDNSL